VSVGKEYRILVGMRREPTFCTVGEGSSSLVGPRRVLTFRAVAMS
jgi:hypothetical protein